MIQPDILFFSWQDLNTLRVSHGNLCKLSFTPQGENVCQFSLTTFSTFSCPSGDYLWRTRQKPRDVSGAADARDHVQVRNTHTCNTPHSLLYYYTIKLLNLPFQALPADCESFTLASFLSWQGCRPLDLALVWQGWAFCSHTHSCVQALL